MAQSGRSVGALEYQCQGHSPTRIPEMLAFPPVAVLTKQTVSFIRPDRLIAVLLVNHGARAT